MKFTWTIWINAMFAVFNFAQAVRFAWQGDTVFVFCLIAGMVSVLFWYLSVKDAQGEAGE